VAKRAQLATQESTGLVAQCSKAKAHGLPWLEDRVLSIGFDAA